MGFVQDMWHSICSFFLGVWDSFCTMLKGIVKFFGTVYDFFDSLLDNIIDLIADGVASLFIIMFGHNTKEDPLAQQLENQLKEAQEKGKIGSVILKNTRVATKVENGKVRDYKAYEVTDHYNDKDMKEIEKQLQKECIIQVSV